MATLKDLCNALPKTITSTQVEYELLRRKNAAYLRRMEALRAEERIFDRCAQARPQKGKYKNTYSKEEAGTSGAITMGVRTGKYTVCVCKVRK